MVALIQSKNHASNKGKTAGRYQFDTNPTGIGLTQMLDIVKEHNPHLTEICYNCLGPTQPPLV